MGYYYDFYSHYMEITRSGFCYDHDPMALEPRAFSYTLDERLDETWGEGLEVCLNPNAKYPLPKDFFVDTAVHYVENGTLYSDIPVFHPYMPLTYTKDLQNEDITPPNGINRVTKAFINERLPERTEMSFAPEIAWFHTQTKNRLGLILIDKIDMNYTCMVFQKSVSSYEMKDCRIDYETEVEACAALFTKMLE